MNSSAPNMCMQAQLRILFLLLVSGAPLTVCAQSQEPTARFSVEPSDPGTPYGVGIQGEVFKFTADVTGAKCYTLGFGDDGEKLIKVLPGSDGMAVHTHSYANPGKYYAKMTAWSDPDCELGGPPPVFTLEVRVKPRPSIPQPPPSVARFSVAPSGADTSWADFTFTARVSQAERYELDFGDGVVASDIEPDSPGEAVRRRHVYKEPKVYTAKMTALRNTGEVVEIDLLISVKAPPPAVAVQWPPPVRSAATVPSDPAKPDILPWLLLLAAIAILLSRGRGLTDTGLVTFEPTRDRGDLEVIGAAVSMRVRHPEPESKISDGAAVISVDNGER